MMQDRDLFRGKQLDTGEWVYGDLLNERNTYIRPSTEGFLTCFKTNSSECVLSAMYAYQVDPVTVSRCTGLRAAKSYRGESEKDRLIWEDDIGKSETGDLWRIYWNDSAGGWWIRHISKDYSSSLFAMARFIEVIGTIYGTKTEVEE